MHGLSAYLRPIVVASFAAALGAWPLVHMAGYGMALRQPLGLTAKGILLVSQAQYHVYHASTLQAGYGGMPVWLKPFA